MTALLILWLGLLAALLTFAVGPPGRGGALTLAYFLDLSLIHVPGVLAALGTGAGIADLVDTRLGFEMTLAGMAAFLAGAVAAHLFDRTGREIIRQSPVPAPAERAAGTGFDRLGWRALAIGAAFYLILSPVFGRLASVTSIASSISNLLILGYWMLLYPSVSQAGSQGDARRRLLALALLPLLPLTTLVTGGFLGFGFHWVLAVLAFCFVMAHRRLWIYLVSPLAVFLGLSLFV